MARHLLAGTNLHILERFARSNVLIALDYDGTLAPIVDDPRQAEMRSRTRVLLAAVTRRYPCAVLSGRAQLDVLRRLRSVGVIEAVGNHGLEPWRYSARWAAPVRSWVAELNHRLCGLAGVWVEDKTFSVAIHYRKAQNKEMVRNLVADVIATLGPLRSIEGQQVFNLLPQGAPHKGMALLAARSRFRCHRAIYIGDDETDEDVFGLDDGTVLGVRVGARPGSRAAYYLRTQREIDRFLATLLALRPSTAADEHG
jgi:trehalose 6-phosphate phosphatase